MILGQVFTVYSGQNPARQSLIKAGLPSSVPGMTIDKVCGGPEGRAGVQETMSGAPHVLPGSRDGFCIGDAKLIDSMIVNGIGRINHMRGCVKVLDLEGLGSRACEC